MSVSVREVDRLKEVEAGEWDTSESCLYVLVSVPLCVCWTG